MGKTNAESQVCQFQQVSLMDLANESLFSSACGHCAGNDATVLQRHFLLSRRLLPQKSLQSIENLRSRLGLEGSASFLISFVCRSFNRPNSVSKNHISLRCQKRTQTLAPCTCLPWSWQSFPDAKRIGTRTKRGSGQCYCWSCKAEVEIVRNCAASLNFGLFVVFFRPTSSSRQVVHHL